MHNNNNSNNNDGDKEQKLISREVFLPMKDSSDEREMGEVVWGGRRDTVNLVRLPPKADEMPARICSTSICYAYRTKHKPEFFTQTFSALFSFFFSAFLPFLFFVASFAIFFFLLVVKLSAQIWHLADEKLA